MTEQTQKETERVQVFTEYLRESGRRITPERFMVLDAIYSCPRHFTAEEVAEALAESRQHIALATVYGTLQLMVEAKLLTTFALAGEPLRYEFNATTHMHLVCTRCGHIRDLRDKALMRAIGQRRYAAFTPERCDVTAYGICSACSRQSMKNKPITHNKPSSPTKQ